jgi:hypothetical protein
VDDEFFHHRGNTYRLIVAIHPPLRTCDLTFVAVDADFDPIDAEFLDQNLKPIFAESDERGGPTTRVEACEQESVASGPLTP